MLSHVTPTIEYKKKAKDFFNEFDKYDSNLCGSSTLGLYLRYYSYEKWLEKLEEEKHFKISETGVPNETYFLVDEMDDIIGIMNIRLALNKNLLEVGGNISYSIRPTKRGNGYNKVNLYLGLLRLQKENIKLAMLNCVKNNIASSSTMKALGGKLYRTHYIERFGEIEDYIFDVDSVIEEYKNKYEPLILRRK